MFGMHHGRSCAGGEHGGGRGRRDWGPFSVEWEIRHEARGGGGGPRGRRRMFDGGELRLVLLALIEAQPRHGYDLIREIEERTGGAYAPSAGVVYPTLTMLADMAFAEEQADGSRKAYAITAAGVAHLEERRAEVQALLDRLAQVGSMRARTDGGPVRRAMGNLKNVLAHRLHSEEVSADTLHEVAAILDEAAQRIERL